MIPSDVDTTIKCPTPEGQAIYDEIKLKIEARTKARTAAKRPPKSLTSLLASFPPLPIESLDSEQANDLTLPKPIAYLTADELDEYLARTDAALGLPPQSTLSNPQAIPPHLSDKELEVRNPNSVYNWLRLHEPQVFLQDGEDASSAATSGKPGSLRGAGKRASLPAPAKADSVQFVEEDGLGYDSSLGGPAPTASSGKGEKTAGGSAKRKRVSEDDVGYRPKGGSSRPSKKKKKEPGEGPTSTKTGRQSTGKTKVKVEKESLPDMDVDDAA